MNFVEEFVLANSILVDYVDRARFFGKTNDRLIPSNSFRTINLLEASRPELEVLRRQVKRADGGLNIFVHPLYNVGLWEDPFPPRSGYVRRYVETVNNYLD